VIGITPAFEAVARKEDVDDSEQKSIGDRFLLLRLGMTMFLLVMLHAITNVSNQGDCCFNKNWVTSRCAEIARTTVTICSFSGEISECGKTGKPAANSPQQPPQAATPPSSPAPAASPTVSFVPLRFSSAAETGVGCSQLHILERKHRSRMREEGQVYASLLASEAYPSLE